jgi:electron transport complex protein RnfB
MPAPSVEDIDALLPQTQCTRCGFSGCRPYAEALARGEVAIDRCPPGGQAGVERLADLLGTPVLALDPACGVEAPASAALIDESKCIGCTLCIQACPVDAIVGASRRMHTVLLEECTGCGLCLPPCPVDCIHIEPLTALQASGAVLEDRPETTWRERAGRARQRHAARSDRLARERGEREERLAAKAAHKLQPLSPEDPQAERKRGMIEAAIARARARRQPPEAG